MPRPQTPVGAEPSFGARRHHRPLGRHATAPLPTCPARSRHRAALWLALLTAGTLLSPQATADTTEHLPSASTNREQRQGELALPDTHPVAGAPGVWQTGTELVLRRPGSRERTLLPAGTRLEAYQERLVRGDGRAYRLALWEASTPGQAGTPPVSASVLAVFPVEGGAPLDILDVKADHSTGFGDTPLPALGHDDAFTIVNRHLGAIQHANQNYTETTLFHVHGGKLRRVSSIFTLQALEDCANTLEQTLSWRVEADDGPYPRLYADVTMTVGPDKRHACGGQTAQIRREYTGAWRWNAGRDRYEPMGGEDLARLR